MEMKALGLNGKPNGFTFDILLGDMPQPYRLSPHTLDEFMNRAVDLLDDDIDYRGGRYAAFFTDRNERVMRFFEGAAKALDGRMLAVNGILMFFWDWPKGQPLQGHGIHKFLSVIEPELDEKAMMYRLNFTVNPPPYDRSML